MNQINVLHSAFTKAKADVREAAGTLKQDRDRIDSRVSSYLGSDWTGIAAESFIDAWDDWKLGATDVLEGLVSMAELLDATHRDFTEQDEASQQRLDTISARIIDRLG